MVEEELEVEVITKTKYIYEDTKCISGVEPEYQWGEIYMLITRREVPDMGLEEEGIYANIERSSLMIGLKTLEWTWLRPLKGCCYLENISELGLRESMTQQV